MIVKCRACLSTKDTIKYYPLSTVFPKYFNTNLTVLELLEVVTVTSVCYLLGAPNSICQICLKQLRDSYKFIDEFKKAQLWLKRKCDQPLADVSGKIEKHNTNIGKKDVIKLDKDEKSMDLDVNIKKDPSVGNVGQALKISETSIHTNQSDDAETSVNKIKHGKNIVYIDHNYPKKIEILEESLVQPETIIIKVDPLDIEPNKIYKEPVKKIKPRAKKNDSQKLDQSSSPQLHTRVSYKFKEPPSVVCEICKNKFYTERALCVHKEIVHRDILIVRAKPVTVTQNDLQKDEINKGQSALQPSEESKKLSVEKNNKVVLVSEKCKSASDSSRVLRSRRQATRGGIKEKKVPVKRRTVLGRAIKKEDQTVICDICQKLYKSPVSLRIHKNKVHPQGKIASEPKTFVCTQCGLQCRTQSEFYNHRRKHIGKKYSCDECKKVYYTTTQLKDHKRTVHGVGLTHRFLCTQCGKRFIHLNGFKYHLATVHSGEMPYMCKFCGYKSFYKTYLLNHEMGHTGEKPYECKLCNKKFKNASSLKEHQFTHRGTSRYNCEYCKKGFIKSWNMKLHWLKHEGKYTCTVCSKGFVDVKVLKFHCSHSHKVEEKEIKEENMDILTHSDTELLFVKELPVENYDLDFN